MTLLLCRGAGNVGEPMEYLMSITKEKSYVVVYLLKLYIEKKCSFLFSRSTKFLYQPTFLSFQITDGLVGTGQLLPTTG